MRLGNEETKAMAYSSMILGNNLLLIEVNARTVSCVLPRAHHLGNISRARNGNLADNRVKDSRLSTMQVPLPSYVVDEDNPH